MKKTFIAILVALLGVSILTSSAFASAEGKGARFFERKLKMTCGFNAYEMARKHTQEEWTAIYKSGSLNDEMEAMCPGAKDFKKHNEKYVYAFFNSYAIDSGQILVG